MQKTDVSPLQQAIQLHEKWEHEAARLAYEEVLKEEPKNDQALYGMGVLLGQHLLRSAEALPYLEAAIEASPKTFAYWHTYIHMLIREGLWKMADALIDIARVQGMQEISLEQLKKDLTLARGEDAAAFLEAQAALLPALPPSPAITSQKEPLLPPQAVKELALLLQKRDFNRASKKLDSLLRKHPQSSLLWHAKINLEHERGQHAQALAATTQATQSLPYNYSLQELQGELLLEAGNAEEAAQALHQARVLNPVAPKAHWLMGDALIQQSHTSAAYPWFVHALLLAESENDRIQSLTALVKALHGEKERLIAAQLLVLLVQQSSTAKFRIACGDLLFRLGWHLQAELAYRLALQQDAASQDALIALATVLKSSPDRAAEAVICMRRALDLELEPKLRRNVLLNLANTLYRERNWASSLEVIDQLHQENEADIDAHLIRGSIQLEMQDLKGLEQTLKKALMFEPGNHDLIYLQALYYGKLGDVKKSMEHFDVLLSKYPESQGGHSARLLTMTHLAGVTPSKIGSACKSYGELMQRVNCGHEPPAFSSTYSASKVLRIGFVSADFREHAAAKFFMPVMRELSKRSDIECIAYCNNATNDKVTNQFMKLFPLWRNVKSMATDTVIQLIKEDKIDILFDLSGHTSGHRLDVFARRAAPLQLTWIGNPGSTGLQTMDYIVVSDLMLDGKAVEQQLTEHLLRLPLAYVFEGGIHSEPVAELPALRNGYLTFGSFNRLVKVNREVVAVWADVLRSIPTARLHIAACEPSGPPAHLRSWLQDEGINEERLSFIARSDFQSYLKSHAEIDICLDTFPFSGGVVTNHALWMGVPTLTLSGELLCGRQSAEVLARVGLDSDFAAADLPALIQRARYWDQHTEQLSAVRQALRPALEAQEKGQAAMVAQALCLGIRQAWSLLREGRPLSDLRVLHTDLGPEYSAAFSKISYKKSPDL